MKYLFLIAAFALNIGSYAQTPCDFSSNVTDSLGNYKNTRDYIVHERNFAGTSSDMFFSLALTDGMPTLNIQYIQKSKDFIKANCLDKNSRMYLQLDNGKIVTLRHIDQENCGTTVRSGEGFNNRIMSGYFMFVKDSFAELKSSPVSVMRIRYATETIDYIFKRELTSELDGKTYTPGDYFIRNLRCIEN
jgi:hypothetical protein